MACTFPFIIAYHGGLTWVARMNTGQSTGSYTPQCFFESAQAYFNYPLLAADLEPHLDLGDPLPPYSELAEGVQPELDYDLLAATLQPYFFPEFEGDFFPGYDWLVVVAFFVAVLAWQMEGRGYPFLSLLYFLAVLAAASEDMFFLLTFLLAFGILLKGLMSHVR